MNHDDKEKVLKFNIAEVWDFLQKIEKNWSEPMHNAFRLNVKMKKKRGDMKIKCIYEETRRKEHLNSYLLRVVSNIFAQSSDYEVIFKFIHVENEWHFSCLSFCYSALKAIFSDSSVIQNFNRYFHSYKVI